MRVNFIVTEALQEGGRASRPASRRIFDLLGIYGLVAIVVVALHAIVPSL